MLTNYVKNNKEKILEVTPVIYNKSKKYKDYIEAVMMKEGLPREFLILAAIESGYNEYAVSQANAVGMWQFTKSTAEDCGLVVNNKIDERKNWKKSTIAAAKYLKWMADDHFDGDYELAILAYNAGIGRIKSLIKKYNTKNPWVLIQYDDLPTESKEFLPKYISFLHYYYYLDKK